MSILSVRQGFHQQLLMGYNEVDVPCGLLTTQQSLWSFTKPGRLKSKRESTPVILPTLTAHGKTSEPVLDVKRERHSLGFSSFNQRIASATFMQIISMINPLKVSVLLVFFGSNLLLTSCLLALQFITPSCCDRHNDSFNLEGFFPGYLYTGAVTSIVPAETKVPHRYRPKWERPALDQLLISWVENEARHDKLLRSPDDILSRAQRDTLQRAVYSTIASPSAITRILNESLEWEEEWASKFFKIICDYQPVRTPKPLKVIANL